MKNVNKILLRNNNILSKMNGLKLCDQAELLVENGYKCYDDLNNNGLGDAVKKMAASIIKEESPYNKFECITETDECNIIPDMVAQYIESDQQEKDIVGKKLLNLLESEAVKYYMENVDDALEEAKEYSESEGFFAGLPKIIYTSYPKEESIDESECYPAEECSLADYSCKHGE
jgi:hypothetical protein